MRRFRALVIGTALLVGGAWPLAGPPSAACATEGPRAALVVDDGSSSLELCVSLDAPTVTGTHLIELAHAQHGVTYSLGFGGQAVCMLNGVGTTGGDCFATYPDFWGYWHGDGRDGWIWGSSGAATYDDVGDGDIEGWVFGSGDSGTTHDRPAALGFDDVCAPTPSPTPTPTPPSGSDVAGGAGGVAGSASEAGTSGASSHAATRPSPSSAMHVERSGPSDGRVEDGERRAAHEPTPADTRPAASPTSEPPPSSAGELRAVSPGHDRGVPPGLMAAIGLGTAFAAAGWWRLRRTRAGAAP
jgi:hypothetical protein